MNELIIPCLSTKVMMMIHALHRINMYGMSSRPAYALIYAARQEIVQKTQAGSAEPISYQVDLFTQLL